MDDKKRKEKRQNTVDQGRIYKDAGPWAGDSFGAQGI